MPASAPVSVRDLPDVGEALAKKLEKLHLHTVWDAALHLPLRYEDETRITAIADAPFNTPCQVQGTVAHCEILFQPRKQLLARIRDASGGEINLRFLHFYPNLVRQLAAGQTVRAIGEIKHGFFGAEMIHPKIRTDTDAPLAESLTPVYPTVAGLAQPTLRRVIAAARARIDDGEVLPEALLAQLKLPPLRQTLERLHRPAPDTAPHLLTDPAFPPRQRLKFDELLAQQLSMRLARHAREQSRARPLHGNGAFGKPFAAALPFALTPAQQRVCAEIRNDLAQARPMRRLLQGDVGSGKTVVAALAALTALEAGDTVQVAVMAPTEILAEQHYHKFHRWFAPLGINTVLLSGRTRKKAKDAAKAGLADGSIRVAVGTHALFQNDMVFCDLGLAIVDEQHRFGVAQRLSLNDKGDNVHQLMMSATPIPRTLAMSFLADLDVSVIDELPPGRTPVRTKLVNCRRRSEVEGMVLHACQHGRQAYWVCPLIEESEALQLQTATETHARLQAALPALNIALIHGRMKAAEKAAVMAAFAAGKTDVLVATTVIEVGVDVPNAALMVIEHAERMGLSQLHQLRGRVGRGAAHSTCVLLFAEPLGEVAKARLKVIYQHTDGFEIARQDLQIRGPGEFLGARQSGAPMLRFADLDSDLHLLEAARQAACELLARHPEAVAAHLARWLGSREAYLQT
ncbi:ATP-dependent DNA helicase RecG [Conchiformibius kuhniae]|uniref:ATP-dependent DNA helicase RecG n=1 Tax=Conchiformibius kuhniae TaxID=211502 RepID=A0ABD8B8B0_9NEIS|nr:ATP-dependent DNA helicase RecG [Conchiformibius kuhniae]